MCNSYTVLQAPKCAIALPKKTMYMLNLKILLKNANHHLSLQLVVVVNTKKSVIPDHCDKHSNEKV